MSFHAAGFYMSDCTVCKIACDNNNSSNYYYYYSYCNIEDVIKMNELMEISCYQVLLEISCYVFTFNFGTIHCASHCISQTFCSHFTKLQTLWQSSSQHFVFPKDPPTFLCRGFCPPDPLGAGFNVDWNRVSVSEILESLDNPIQVMSIIIIVIFTLSLQVY